MREDIEIQNFGEEAAFCSLELILGADFADLFEVKEGRVHKRGQLSVLSEVSRLTLSYKRHSFERKAHIDFSEQPTIIGNQVMYETVVPARGTWKTCFELTPVIGDLEVQPRSQCGARSSGRHHSHACRSGRTGCRS